MNEFEPTYQRLPGVGRGLARRTRLWLGPDHLLQVTGSGVSEEYQRFYFGDIQAFVMGQTERGKLWNLVWGVLALVMGLWAIGAGSAPARIVLGITAGCFLLALMINVALGPTSTCQLVTAVNRVNLPSLGRWHRAERVLVQLQPLIEAEQGSLQPEMMTDLQTGGDAGSNRSSPAPPTGNPAQAE